LNQSVCVAFHRVALLGRENPVFLSATRFAAVGRPGGPTFLASSRLRRARDSTLPSETTG
jgi:hypothetical protein